jgi:hypothetical protein
MKKAKINIPTVDKKSETKGRINEFSIELNSPNGLASIASILRNPLIIAKKIMRNAIKASVALFLLFTYMNLSVIFNDCENNI